MLQHTNTVQPTPSSSLPSTTSAPAQLAMDYSHTQTPTPSQLFQTLQTKAVQHTQQSGHSTTQTLGPEVQAWQMVEQVPTNEQDREENERNKYEFKSWKGTIRYPAPPQALWNNTQKDLADLYERSNVPQMPDFEHKYLAALFAAMEKPISEQVGRAQFFVSDQQAIWLLKLKQENPPIVSAVWRFGYQSWDRDRQPLEHIKRKGHSSLPC